MKLLKSITYHLTNNVYTPARIRLGHGLLIKESALTTLHRLGYYYL